MAGASAGEWINGVWVPAKGPETPATPTIANPFGDGHTLFKSLFERTTSAGDRVNLAGALPYQGTAPTRSNAQGMFNQVFDQGMNGSIRSFDKAANRVRDRLATEAGSMRNSYTQQNMGRGQGAIRSGLEDIGRQQIGAYGDALVGLEKEFEDSRLAGLGIANQSASGVSDDEALFQKGMQEFFKNSNDHSLENRKITNDTSIKLEELMNSGIFDILEAINTNYGIESGIFKFLLDQGGAA